MQSPFPPLHKSLWLGQIKRRTGLNLPDSRMITKGDKARALAFLDSHVSTEHSCAFVMSGRVRIRGEQPSVLMLSPTGKVSHSHWGRSPGLYHSYL